MKTQMDDKWSRLFSEVDRMLLTEKDRIIVAVDGRCASGKTTLARLLNEKYDCNVFHMDDFFLRPKQRTEERLNAPGGNVDHERFLSEVLLPLSEGKEVTFQRYDCHGKCLLEPETVIDRRLNFVEGVYSLHPDLISYYDLTVFIDISEEEQKSRIEKRNSPEMAGRFFSTWIPLEEMYFNAFTIRENADIII